MHKLGRIDAVDLREVWTSEDKHFTPWLAQPENLELLGEALGIDLQLEAQEKDVGPFRADLLCKNTAEEDSWVVIENQIEKTDHKHLGQLLTYASGLHAKTVVWISAEFSEEHRAAIDWLNRIANRSVQFLALKSNCGKSVTHRPHRASTSSRSPMSGRPLSTTPRMRLTQKKGTARRNFVSGIGPPFANTFANITAHCGHRSRRGTIGIASALAQVAPIRRPC
jgi:hypothetical protein